MSYLRVDFIKKAIRRTFKANGSRPRRLLLVTGSFQYIQRCQKYGGPACGFLGI
jgi:hypothetical protein